MTVEVAVAVADYDVYLHAATNIRRHFFLPVLMEVKGNICELWIVVKQHLLQIWITDYLLPAILIH